MFFSTLSIVISTFSITLSLRASNSGMLVLSSIVKTLVKKLFKISALPLLSVLIDPVGSSKFPTVSFVLV